MHDGWGQGATLVAYLLQASRGFSTLHLAKHNMGSQSQPLDSHRVF